MNYSVASLEILTLVLGLGLLMLDLVTPVEHRRRVGYVAIGGLAFLFLVSLGISVEGGEAVQAFGGMFVQDTLSLFFKRFFILAAFLVMLIAMDFSDRLEGAKSEYYSLIVFALSGMLFAASANNFALLFAALELITVSFYVLTSFQRSKLESLEAGVKYLILGALSSAFLIYGIALVYGSTGTLQFDALHARLSSSELLSHQPVLILGLLLVLAGLGFKIAAFPFQSWAPDVYQGSPLPTTAFLAIGSKAAGIVLLLRVFLVGALDVTLHWEKVFMAISGVTILYGSLCAIPQRNLKRLMGYSSIANAGYLLMGFSTLTKAGTSAMLFYLSGYLFTVLAAFTVISIVSRQTGSEDISSLAGLGRRSPFLAAGLTLSMVSLAGVPPLAGFFGKFMLLKAVVEEGLRWPAYFALFAVALVGVVISFYYYFGVIRAIYWSKDPEDVSPIEASPAASVALAVCMAGIVLLGVFPSWPVEMAVKAASVFKL